MTTGTVGQAGAARRACLFLGAALLLGCRVPSAGSGPTDHGDGHLHRFFRDQYAAAARVRFHVGDELQRRADPDAERYVELVLQDLRVEAGGSPDREVRLAWKDAISFFALETTLSWDEFPPRAGGAVVYYNGLISTIELDGDDALLGVFRGRILRAAEEWLEERRGRIVFSTCLVGRPGARDGSFVPGATEGFCSLEEQVCARNVVCDVPADAGSTAETRGAR